MKVYFYHTQDIQRLVREHAEGCIAGHMLYGALHLKDEGIDVVWHRHKASVMESRLRLILHTTWQVLRHARGCDAIYATHYRGLDLVVLLHAIGLLRQPIVVWHHQPMQRQRHWWHRMLARVFYRGFDKLIFFSDELLKQSLATPCAAPERMHVGCWGPDLDYYDQFVLPPEERHGFVHSGKELRDIDTLVKAFARTTAELHLYTMQRFHALDYRGSVEACPADNIHVHYTKGLIPHQLCANVTRAACVTVCCLKTKYTVGLTTVVEAMGLGLPLICSRNKTMPFDMEADGIGISVEYGDVDGWQRAIEWMQQHPDEAAEMGRRARRLAENKYNDRLCARHVAGLLRQVCS